MTQPQFLIYLIQQWNGETWVVSDIISGNIIVSLFPIKYSLLELVVDDKYISDLP